MSTASHLQTLEDKDIPRIELDKWVWRLKEMLDAQYNHDTELKNGLTIIFQTLAHMDAQEKENNQLRAQVVRLREAIETAGHFTTYDSESQNDYPFSHSLAYQQAISESPQQAAKELLGPTVELLRVLRHDPWRNNERIDKEIERIERVLNP